MELVYLLLALAIIAGCCYAMVWAINQGPIPPIAKWLAVCAVVVLGVVLALGAADSLIGLNLGQH